MLMKEKLTAIGFSDKEASVYIAALPAGRVTADQLAKKAGVARTTVYNQIDTLVQYGLMSKIDIGKKTYFFAESPDHLQRVIEQKQNELAANAAQLTQSFPQLQQLFAQNKSTPTVRYFEGKAGVDTLRQEILKMDGKELRVISDLDLFESLFSFAEREKFSKERKKRKINTRLIHTYSGTDVPEKFSKYPELTPHDYLHIERENISFEFDLYIFDQSIAIISLEPENIWGMRIDSEPIMKSMKSLFEIIWQLKK